MVTLTNDIFVLSAARTPISKFNGQMCSETPPKLGSYVLNECIYRGRILKDYVSEIILGQILTAGQGLNPARQAALLSYFPPSIPAFTVNMACVSGLKSVILGFQALRVGSGSFILAGGQENMSLSPHTVMLRRSKKFGDTSLVDSMLNDSLIDPTYNEPMGITAERISKLYGISRLEQDEYSLRSHLLASQAIIDRKFEAEIVPIYIKDSKDSSFPNLLSTDEGPRLNSSLANFSKLKPYWLPDGSGSITPGNASTINDGAACVLLTKYDSLLKIHSYDNECLASDPPLAKIVSFSQTGCHPGIMGIAPISAIKQALGNAKWQTEDVDIWEINEAFAATTIACLYELNIDISKLNIAGGAIALGHPVGASGCRILVSLIYRLLEDSNARRGVAALCAGGGMSIAVCIEKYV